MGDREREKEKNGPIFSINLLLHFSFFFFLKKKKRSVVVLFADDTIMVHGSASIETHHVQLQMI